MHKLNVPVFERPILSKFNVMWDWKQQEQPGNIKTTMTDVLYEQEGKTSPSAT